MERPHNETLVENNFISKHTAFIGFHRFIRYQTTSADFALCSRFIRPGDEATWGDNFCGKKVAISAKLAQIKEFPYHKSILSLFIAIHVRWTVKHQFYWY